MLNQALAAEAAVTGYGLGELGGSGISTARMRTRLALSKVRRGLAIDIADCTRSGRAVAGRFNGFRCRVISESVEIPSPEPEPNTSQTGLILVEEVPRKASAPSRPSSMCGSPARRASPTRRSSDPGERPPSGRALSGQAGLKPPSSRASAAPATTGAWRIQEENGMRRTAMDARRASVCGRRCPVRSMGSSRRRTSPTSPCTCSAASPVAGSPASRPSSPNSLRAAPFVVPGGREPSLHR